MTPACRTLGGPAAPQVSPHADVVAYRALGRP